MFTKVYEPTYPSRRPFCGWKNVIYGKTNTADYYQEPKIEFGRIGICSHKDYSQGDFENKSINTGEQFGGPCGSIYLGAFLPSVDEFITARTTRINYGTHVLGQSMFTVNNLNESILKTNANTMKVTYELRWE